MMLALRKRRFISILAQSVRPGPRSDFTLLARFPFARIGKAGDKQQRCGEKREYHGDCSPL